METSRFRGRVKKNREIKIPRKIDFFAKSKIGMTILGFKGNII